MDWDALLSITLRILGVVVLVLLNGFFVAAEFSLVKVRDTQLSPLVRRGHRRAQVADFILQRLDAFLERGPTGHHADQPRPGMDRRTGIRRPAWAGVRLAERGLAGSARMRWHSSLAFRSSPSCTSARGNRRPSGWPSRSRWRRRCGFPIPCCGSTARPIRLWWCSTGRRSGCCARSASNWPARRAARIRRRNCACCWRAAQKQAGGTALGRDIVLNALDLRRRVAREVMRPRQEIVALDTEASIAECLDVAEKTRYSRFPLCEGGEPRPDAGASSTSRTSMPCGIKARSGADLLPAARKLIYVPETRAAGEAAAVLPRTEAAPGDRRG